jgi:hypothetical protein
MVSCCYDTWAPDSDFHCTASLDFSGWQLPTMGRVENSCPEVLLCPVSLLIKFTKSPNLSHPPKPPGRKEGLRSPLQSWRNQGVEKSGCFKALSKPRSLSFLQLLWNAPCSLSVGLGIPGRSSSLALSSSVCRVSYNFLVGELMGIATLSNLFIFWKLYVGFNKF